MNLGAPESSFVGDLVTFTDVVRSPIVDYSRKHLVVQSLSDLMLLPVGLAAFAGWSFANAAVFDPSEPLSSLAIESLADEQTKFLADFETYAKVKTALSFYTDIRSTFSVYLEDTQLDSFFARLESEDLVVTDIYIELTQAALSEGFLIEAVRKLKSGIESFNDKGISIQFVVPEGEDVVIDLVQYQELSDLADEFILVKAATVQVSVKNEEQVSTEDLGLIAAIPEHIDFVIEEPREILYLALGTDVQAEIRAWAMASQRLQWERVEQVNFLAESAEDLFFTPSIFADIARLSKLTDIQFDMENAGSVTMVASSVESVERVLSSSYRVSLLEKLSVDFIELNVVGDEQEMLVMSPKMLRALGDIVIEGVDVAVSLPSFEALTYLLGGSAVLPLSQVDAFVLDGSTGLDGFDFRLLDDLDVTLLSFDEPSGTVFVQLDRLAGRFEPHLFSELDQFGVTKIAFSDNIEIGAAEMLAISRTGISFAEGHSVQATVGVSFIDHGLNPQEMRRPDQLIVDDFWLSGVDQIKVVDDQNLGEVELANVIERWLELSQEFSGQSFDESVDAYTIRGYADVYSPMSDSVPHFESFDVAAIIGL